MIYLCDIDGTLSDLSHRLHFITGDKPDWRAFFAACVGDRPHSDVISLIQTLAAAGHTIILTSGRSDEVRMETRDWLDRYKVPYDWLLMRKEGDHRPDNIVKSEMLDKLQKQLAMDLDQIAGVFDDRDQVVEMWRKRGLRCYQVAKGDF